MDVGDIVSQRDDSLKIDAQLKNRSSATNGNNGMVATGQRGTRQNSKRSRGGSNNEMSDRRGSATGAKNNRAVAVVSDTSSFFLQSPAPKRARRAPNQEPPSFSNRREASEDYAVANSESQKKAFFS